MIVEINAAGCSDGCRHCAVDGRMPLGAFYSAGQLRQIRDEWGPLCIRYEPTAHPEFPEIYRPDISLEHGGWLATNGYGIAHRPDWEHMLAKMAADGICTLSLTVHGLETHHDWFVCRPGAFQTIVTATRRAKEQGFQVTWQIFVDHKGVADVGPLVKRAVQETGVEPSLDLPYHRVNQRLWVYEPYRLTLSDVRAFGLPDMVSDAGQNAFRNVEGLSGASWLERWRSDPSQPEFKHPFEPLEWPMVTVPEFALLRIEKNGSVWHDPMCGPLQVVGHHSQGATAIAERLGALPKPVYCDLDPMVVTLVGDENEELHPTGFSFRYKEISKAKRLARA